MLVVLGLVCMLVLAYFIGNEFKGIAEMKGHEGNKYFWWSFLLGPIGYLMVIALPDRADKAKKSYAPNDELPDL